MAFIQQSAIPGIVGYITISGYALPASRWQFQMNGSSIAIPTVCSRNYVDMLPGFRTVTINAEGFVRDAYNPFTAPRNQWLLTYQDIKCYIDNPDQGNTFAQAPQALITSWTYLDDAAGTCNFKLEAVGSFKFYDFSGREGNP